MLNSSNVKDRLDAVVRAVLQSHQVVGWKQPLRICEKTCLGLSFSDLTHVKVSLGLRYQIHIYFTMNWGPARTLWHNSYTVLSIQNWAKWKQ
jgi:hypothetical protein